MKVIGWIGSLLEIAFFLNTFKNIIELNPELQKLNPIVSYWLGFTVLTGFWELVYISNRKEINAYSNILVLNDKSVWTNKYSISMVLPWNLAKLFYAEYGAWADREYKSYSDDWSLTVEGSHCGVCGFFSLLALWSQASSDFDNYYLAMAVAMGSQFMNSLLYMISYFNQVHNKHNVNYDRPDFPSGKYLLARPFMYINYLWLLFPAYAILLYVKI